MANPTLGPLFTGVDPDQLTAERAKAAAGFVAALIAIRVAPQTLSKVAKYGLAVEVGSAGELIATPFTATNALPQPFGFVPSGDYGLPADWFLPKGLGEALPDIVPGASEQKAAAAAAAAARRDARAADERERFNALAAYASNAIIESYIRDALNPATNGSYADAAGVVALLQGELNRRAVQTQVENVTRGAYNLGTEFGGSNVADQVGSIQPGSFLDTTGTQPALPSGFVEITTGGAGLGSTFGLLGPNQGPAGIGTDFGTATATGAGFGTIDAYNERAQGAKDGNYPDKFFAIMAGDP